jgi:hypothetical protein
VLGKLEDFKIKNPNGRLRWNKKTCGLPQSKYSDDSTDKIHYKKESTCKCIQKLFESSTTKRVPRKG